jgi:transcriptional regulator with XRE-family HTH domain
MSVLFGTEVRNARTRKEISLREVAKKLGFTPVYISDIERGNRNPPGPNTVREWAEIVGLDADSLIRLAAMERPSVELPINGSPSKGELAFALARKWPQMTRDQERELLEYLNKMGGVE